MVPQIPDQIIALMHVKQEDGAQALKSIDEETRSFALNWLNQHSYSLENSPQIEELRSLEESLREDKKLPEQVLSIMEIINNTIELLHGDYDLIYSESCYLVNRNLDTATKKIAFDWFSSHSDFDWPDYFQKNGIDYIYLPIIKDVVPIIQESVKQYELFQNPSELLQNWIRDPNFVSLNDLILFLQESSTSDYTNHITSLLTLDWERLVPLLQQTLNQPDKHRLKSILPILFEKIGSDQVINFLQRQDEHGYTPLHTQEALKDLFDACPEKIDSNQIINLLQIQNKYGSTPLHLQESLKDLFDTCPEKIDSNQIINLLQIQDKHGNTPLHKEGALKDFLDACPENLDSNQIINLLQIQNDSGNTPLHREGALKDFLDACPKNLDSNQIINLLQKQDNYGHTPLHREGALKDLLNAFPEKVDFNTLSQLLKTQNEKGEFFLLTRKIHYRFSEWSTFPGYKNLQQILQLVPERLSIGQLLELLKAQDDHSRTILHEQQELSQILPILQQYPERDWTEIFSLQDKSGNTPLHSFFDLSTVKNILKRLDPSVMDIGNRLKQTLLDRFYIPSTAWLQAPKTTVIQESLNEDEYEGRANALKEQVLSLWDTLSFGEEEGQVPPIFLRSGSQNFTKEQVHAALGSMLEKIVSKLPWLGTPPEGDREALHEFYTPMLLNFEKIVQKLQEKADPNETAGVLFDIAKTELEGRCAAAYQGEIEQSAALISGEEANLSTDALLERGAKNTLVEVIEKIMRSLGSTDVHTYNQLAHAGGLLSAPDPLSHFSVANCRERLEREWVIPRILPNLSEAFKKIPTEQMIDWLKEKTDDLFGDEYLSLKREAQAREEELLDSTKNSLLGKGLNEGQVDSAIELFKSSRGASLAIKQEAFAKTKEEIKRALLETISTHLGIDVQEDVLEEGLNLLSFEEENWQEVFDHIRRELNIPIGKRLSWQNMVTAFIISKKTLKSSLKSPSCKDFKMRRKEIFWKKN